MRTLVRASPSCVQGVSSPPVQGLWKESNRDVRCRCIPRVATSELEMRQGEHRRGGVELIPYRAASSRVGAVTVAELGLLGTPGSAPHLRPLYGARSESGS